MRHLLRLGPTEGDHFLRRMAHDLGDSQGCVDSIGGGREKISLPKTKTGSLSFSFKEVKLELISEKRKF